ncbi:transcriptional antiterminator, Rof [Sulfurirhabdus autotrophica]|uniref:Rof transcriptional antiterminator n=1 Tax=Sulfurirhabdus autotrophica TaxID=1706046 RepID=A0A4R3YDE3_9PROT|nr:transcriptional antiterminator, Rof [Sulfurirhabdus autotrophica]TCV90056.1 Rof transcriptional antiterminator [Sulfurirhabdus autotrophica]
MSEKYQPIACADHERLELSVMRKSLLEVRYETADGVMLKCGTSIDVQTRNGEEWFKFGLENGNQIEIRLDKIISFTEVKRA